MGRGLISFLLAAGAGTWIYTKFQRSSGNNTQQSAVAAAVCAAVAFFILFVVLGMIIK